MTVVSHGVHLACIAVLEGADFQIDEQMAAEEAVVKDEVDVVVLAADGDALLPGLEAEAGAEFEEEGLEMIEECSLEVAFEVVGFFGEAGEFENVGIADEIGDLRGRFAGLLPGALDDGVLLGGKSGAVDGWTNFPGDIRFRRKRVSKDLPSG